MKWWPFKISKRVKQNRGWSLFLIIIGLRVLTSLHDTVYLPEGKVVRITGRVRSQPRFIGNHYRLLIDGIEADYYGAEIFEFGDKVEAIGKVERREFASSRDRAKTALKISEMKLAEVDSAENPGNPLDTLLYRVRAFTHEHISASLPSREAALVAGAAFGDKQDLPFEFRNSLRRTGTSHVVVASGTNVALVGGFVLGLGSFLVGRKGALVAASLILWVYALTAGLEAPMVRAAVMGSVVYLASFVGRSISSAKVLVTTAGLMLLLRPNWLADLGFQLSFAAFLGTGWASSMSLRFKKFPDVVAQTLGAQVFTLPLILWHFGWGSVSWVAPIANLLVLWLVGPIMSLGFLILGFGLVSPALERFVALLAYLPSHLFVVVVEGLAKL